MSPEQSLPTSPELTPQTSPHEVPGENFIDRNETAGLPGVNLEEYSQEQAKKVVRAHRYGFLRGLGGGGRKHKRSRSQEPLANNERRTKQTRRGFFTGGDVEKSAEVRSENKQDAPKGVLSALLSFYEPSNGFQSGMSTPARSSFDESRPSSMYGGKAPNNNDSASTTSSAALMPPPPVPNRAEGQGYPPTMPNVSTNSLRPPSHPWTRSLGLGDARPSAARSGAGVFGPLIASAGNIAGVAAPAPATVAPNCKRPGYHLSRYVIGPVSLRLCLTIAQILAREQPAEGFPESEVVDAVAPA